MSVIRLLTLAYRVTQVTAVTSVGRMHRYLVYRPSLYMLLGLKLRIFTIDACHSDLCMTSFAKSMTIG